MNLRTSTPSHELSGRGTKSFLVLVAPLLVISGCASNQGHPAVCGDHGTLLSTTTHVSTSVTLKPRPRDPALYLISDHFQILMRPIDVVSLLESRVAQPIHAREDQVLLAAIKAKLPITDDTDLLKFSFTSVRLFERPEFIAADLLKAGAASVVDLWGDADEGTILSSIVEMKLEGEGTWRDFCEPTGQSILFVTDTIAN